METKKKKAIGQIQSFIKSSCSGKTKIFSAPEQNELGINKISSHQATGGHYNFLLQVFLKLSQAVTYHIV